MIYLLLSNIGRRLAEWADRQLDKREQSPHVIDDMRRRWALREARPPAWYGA